MRRALAPGSASAACCVGLEAAAAESKQVSSVDSHETLRDFTRCVCLSILAAYYLFCTTVIPSLHSCFPFADCDRGWELLGGSASHEAVDHAPALRGDVDGTDASHEAGTCVACLLGARLRGLSPPAGVSVPFLTPAQRIPRQAGSIPALAHPRIQILPRAPPGDAPS